MARSYSGNHIAGDHTYTNITKCNIAEPQMKYVLEWAVIDYWGGGGGGGVQYVLLHRKK